MSTQLPDSQPLVTITHPDPGVGDARVPESAVPHWRNAGWNLAPDQDVEIEQFPRSAQRFEGQPQVRLYHPELGRTETFAESAVPHWRSKGWVPAEEATAHEFDGKTVEDLRELAGKRGLKKSGTKDELLARLQGQEQDPESAGEPEREPAQESEENQAGDEPASDSEEGH